MKIGDKVRSEDLVGYIFWIYDSGYIEIKTPAGKVELVEKTEIEVISD